MITLLESGGAEVAVLEGSLDLQRLQEGRPIDEAPISVAGGNRVRLSSEGKVVWQRPLTEADYVAFLQGPLFKGFTEPLSGMPALEAFLQRRFPGCSPPRPRNRSAVIPWWSASTGSVAERALTMQPLPAGLATQNAAYLTPVLQGILDSSDCDHDRSRWEAFQSRMASTASLMPTSEVIACPMPAGSWNPEVIVSRWMSSPLHSQILINRPKARHLDCVRLDRSGRTVGICTLWSPVSGAAP